MVDTLPVAYYKLPFRKEMPAQLEIPIHRPISKPILSSSCEYDYGKSIDNIKLHRGELLHKAGFCGEGMLICVFDDGWKNFNTILYFTPLFENGQILGTKDLLPGINNIYYTNDSLDPILCDHGTSTVSEFENTKMLLDNLQLSVAQLEQSIFELRQQEAEQSSLLAQNLSSSFNQLQTQLAQWEQNYLLISPMDGFCTMTKYWQHNQNIVAGEVLTTVVLQHKTKIIGIIELPPRGAGKVKEGQFVNVKFDNYPHMEYGMIKVQIAHISLVP